MLPSFFFLKIFYIYFQGESNIGKKVCPLNIFFFKIFYPYFIRELNQGKKVYPINPISPKFFILISKRN